MQEGEGLGGGVLVSHIPEVGVTGPGSLVGLKAQSFPCIIRALLSVSYSSGTNNSLSSIHGTKKRQFQCQNAYCLKCRFLFFQSKSIQRKLDEKMV